MFGYIIGLYSDVTQVIAMIYVPYCVMYVLWIILKLWT